MSFGSLNSSPKHQKLLIKISKPKGAEAKDAAKITKQEASLIKPAPPKPESKPKKSAKKEPGTKANKGSKGKKDEKQDAAKEGTTPSENGESKAEEVLYISC
uniref:High mobility group nucleosome-binding domain-containing protein 3 n=1 Tax=Laticauda laticaudata TaxID=8630 RepID=A0A8C5WUM5_LATLA